METEIVESVEIGHHYTGEEEPKKKMTAWVCVCGGGGGSERRDGSRCGGDLLFGLYAFKNFTVKASWGGAGAVSGAR